MFDDASPVWWYEEGGRPSGPVTAAALRRLVVDGRLSPVHRVWKSGMAGWTPLGSVPELAPMLEGVPPPILPSAPPASPAPPPTAPAVAAGYGPAPTWVASAFEPIPVGVTILLAVVTFGVYGLVKLYQTAKGYEQLAGRDSRFALYFWLFIGLGVGGIFVNAATGLAGIPLGIASAVFQVLALAEALRVRDEGMHRHAVTPTVTAASTHKVLLVVAIVLAPVLVGLVVSIVQAVKWFSDWNAIVDALRGGRAPPR